MSLTRLIRRLRRSKSGVAMIEFALGAPVLLTAGLWGSEMANYALINMKVSQLAEHIADNASRIGDAGMLQNRKIYESDINDIMYGAQLQAGGGMDLFDHARVFVSSVEVDADDKQYIHWQRCRGTKNVASGYGVAGTSLGTVGIGPAGQEVFAQPDDAVIFVEVNYTYQPLVSERFLGSRDIQAIASFTVRDDRDLSQIYQRDAADTDDVQTCTAYRGEMGIAKDGSFTS